jgi:hypothetical protein
MPSAVFDVDGIRDSHGALLFREVILKKPITRLPQSGFAAHLVDLQMELCLFVRGFRFHGSISFLVALWIFVFEASLPHGLDRLERGFNRKSNAVRRNRQESKLFLCEFGYFEGIWRPSGCVRKEPSSIAIRGLIGLSRSMFC